MYFINSYVTKWISLNSFCISTNIFVVNLFLLDCRVTTSPILKTTRFLQKHKIFDSLQLENLLEKLKVIKCLNGLHCTPLRQAFSDNVSFAS